jgi:hypothetical protein
MSIQSVAIIFDNRARPETTGVYCRRALGNLVDVEHFLPTELSRLAERKFDLYLRSDDGLQYQLPGGLHPCAFWAIDTHLDFGVSLASARNVDFVFAAQRELFFGTGPITSSRGPSFWRSCPSRREEFWTLVAEPGDLARPSRPDSRQKSWALS